MVLNISYIVYLRGLWIFCAGVRSHTVHRRCGKSVRESGVHQWRRVRPRPGPERRGQAKAVLRRDNRLPLGGHRQVQRNPPHRCHTQHVRHATSRRPVPVDAKFKGTYTEGEEDVFYFSSVDDEWRKLYNRKSEKMNRKRRLRYGISRQCAAGKSRL